MRRQDWIIAAGILILAAFMPMAIGGTLVVGYIIGETIVCLLLLVWAIEMWRAPAFPARAQALKFALPIIALVGYVAFQLVPLPPWVLRIASPTTYQVYARAFPDWPRVSPYADISATVSASPKTPSADGRVVVLPTLEEAKTGAPIPFAAEVDHSGSSSNAADAESQGLLRTLALNIYGTRWRPLTLSPPQTWGALLMLATSGGLFLLVGFFSIGGGNEEVEASFRQTIAIALLAIGAAVAIIGLVQQATWDGKILWFYVPLDWGTPGSLDSPRASGPFVNPDHFAGYLAAIFPLALSGALFPNALVSGKWSTGSRIVCAALGFMIFVAVLASQSRAGWISIAVATTLVASLSIQSSATSHHQDGRPRYLRTARVALGTLTVMLVLATIFVGASGVSQTGSRLHSTLSDASDLAGRIDTWKAGLRIFRDHWLSGIGLGSWPEIFARYAPAPWSENFAYETENDYLQFAAEVGIVGLLLAAWFVYLNITRLKRGFARLPSSTRFLEAALVSGVVVIAVVEFFDFDLQIPAIAFTFAIIAGLAVRLVTGAGESDADDETEIVTRHSIVARWTMAAAIVLLIACVCQPRESYPYNLTQPMSPADARHMLVLYPANPVSHTWLTASFGERMPQATKLRELETTIWLDPTNPSTRDALAGTLSDAGKTGEALDEIKTSVFNSPSASTHLYLSPRIVVWLQPAVHSAIERGYLHAVASNFDGALSNLGLFYEQLGNYSVESALFARAAGQTNDPEAKYRLLVDAGRASALAGRFDVARDQLRQATDIEPDNLVAYETLIRGVLARSNDTDGMSRTVAEAMKNGVDGYDAWSVVASATAQMGDLKVAEDAINQALTYQPGSLKDLIELGNLYAASGDNERAVRTLQKAADMRGNSGDVYFALARAEEAAYDYGDAEKSYVRAIDLAPQNASYKASYDGFMQRMKKAADQQASDPPR